MKKSALLVVFLFTLSLAVTLPAADAVLLSLPQSVIAETLNKSLPIQFTEGSETLAGTIGVNRVNNLVIKDQLISGLVSLSGRDMQINTSFGNQQIRVNVGNVDLNFTVSATTRYDKAGRTLLLHPTVTGVDGKDSQNSEVGKLIIALFNDQDIPIALDKLDPIITDIGSRKIVIDMQVEDVVLKPGKIDVYLSPLTAARN